MRSISIFTTLLGLLFLSGCGGGGGDATPQLARVKFEVAWPTRGREFNAPNSALSAVLTLPAAVTANTDLTLTMNRTDSNDAYKAAVLSPDAVRAGSFSARVRFFTERSGTGTVTAEANIPVTVDSSGLLLTETGQPIGPIAFESKISRLSFRGYAMITGEATPNINLYGLSANSDLIAIPTEALKLEITSGTGKLSRSANGNYISEIPGKMMVRAQLDGLLSDEVEFDTISAKRVGVEVKAMATLKNGTILVAELNGNELLVIDPQSGVITKRIPTAFPARTIAPSADMNTVYVGSPISPSYQKLDLSAGTAAPSVDLSSVFYSISTIAVDPTDSNTIVVIGGAFGQKNTFVVRNGQVLPNGISQCYAAFISISGQAFITGLPGVTKCQIDANGLTELFTANQFATAIAELNGEVYFSSGQVMRASDLVLVRTLPKDSADEMYLDLPNNAVYFLSDPYSGNGLPGLRKVSLTTGVLLNSLEFNIISIVESNNLTQRPVFVAGSNRIAVPMQPNELTIFSDLP